ncbi:hypothetical protein ACHWQZ_G007293 [Mnemiopsis leidyi]
MATQASQRKAYAARSQASNVLDGTQQPDIPRPGRRLQQQAVSNIFSNEEAPNTKQYERSKPAPAPFLTEDNAVNTHGRLGGYVEQSDSLLTVQPTEFQPAPGVQVENSNDPYSEIQKAKFTENQNVAQGHKKRNMTSTIFSDQPNIQPDRPVYDRKNISNVF